MDLQMPEMNGLDAHDRDSQRISRGANHRADHLRRRRAGSARSQSRRSGLPAEEFACTRNCWTPSAPSMPGKRPLSPEVSFQLAEHATDDALTPAEIAVLRLIAAGQCQQTDRRSALDHRRNRQGPSQEHPLQIGRQRPNPRRHDWDEAGNHRVLVNTQKSLRKRPLGASGPQPEFRNLDVFCGGSSQLSPAAGPARAFYSCAPWWRLR